MLVTDKLQEKKNGLEQAIFHEKVNSLYKALPSSVVANIVIASVMALILWKLIDNTLLIVWYLVFISINIARYILFNIYTKSDKKTSRLIFWDNAFYFLLIMVALCWSSVSIWMLPDDDSIYHYFPALILIGISAGAVTTLSYSMKCIITYLAFLLIPLFIVEVIHGSYVAYSVAGLTIVLAVFSVTSARRINSTITENITLNYDSQKYTENLIQSRNAAIEANSAKTNFISMISHELRTPLNAILGFSQLLKMSDAPVLNKEQDEQVEGILESGKHLLSLIEELLDLSKIESHKLKVTIEDVSLTYILSESLALMSPVASEYNIAIINNVDNKELNLVKADTKRLKQIFINLISNAIKYNHEHGKVIIDVETIANEKVRVTVSDTGHGLTKEQQDVLFTPFQRHNTKIEGIGLGLYITQNIIELMQGDIGVESEVNKGSSFWFELPLAN